MQTAKRKGVLVQNDTRRQTKVRTEKGLTGGSGSLEVTSDLN